MTAARLTAALSLAAGLTPACGGGGAAPATVEVVVENFAFEPESLTVRPGTKVVFRNLDSSAHTATAKGVFDTGTLGTATVTVTGTVAYLCDIHQYMTGKITTVS